MPRTTLKKGQTQTSKEEGGSTARSTSQIEKYYSGGKREFTYKKNDRGKVIKVELKGGGMSSGQAKLAAKAPPPNKIDAKDFAVLRAEKAKGRGMGLQDEKVKPGKVMKAKYGKMMKYKRGSGLDLPVINSVKPTVNKSKRAQNLSNMKIQFTKQKNRAGINSGTLDKILSKTKNPYSDLKATTAKGPKNYMKSIGVFPKVSGSKFTERRKELAGATKALKATRVGKIALGVAAAGIGAKKYLESKMKKKDEPKKKMGGGMMMQRPMGYKGGGMDMGGPKAKIMQYIKNKKDDGQRLTMRDKDFIKSVMPKKKMGGGMMNKPMGYKSGTMVKARGCKLGRTRPTKIT